MLLSSQLQNSAFQQSIGWVALYSIVCCPSRIGNILLASQDALEVILSALADFIDVTLVSDDTYWRLDV